MEGSCSLSYRDGCNAAWTWRGLTSLLTRP
jgi:hypothetical protein